MAELALINDRIVPADRAKISIDDWAFRYGWGLFETIRVHQGCPLFLDRHLERLCRTAPLLDLGDDSATERERWRRSVIRVLKHAEEREAVINCYWTRGSAMSSVAPSRIVRVRAHPHYPRRGLRLWVAPWRLEPTFPGAGVKTLAYFPYIFAGATARRHNFDEALVLNAAGRIADGAASSIFLISGREILTPRLDQGTLAGITRGVVIEIARSLGIRCRERVVPWKLLLDADAVFVASALRGVVAVQRIETHWRQQGTQPSVFRRIIAAYKRQVLDEITAWHQGH